MVNKNKAQAFSADILVVVVIVLFGALFLVMNKIDQEQQEDLQKRAEQAAQESQIIVNELKTMNVIDQNNRINTNDFLSLNEEELKRKLNLQNDFAIVFEKNGNLVQIDSEKGITCVGSSSIKVNGKACE